MKKKRDRTKKPPTRSKARLRTKARSRHARRSEVGIDRENSMSGLVQDLARPLGVERPPDAPVITSDEILSARDRRRWRIEQHTEEQARDAGEA
jgi:hypothetical protein